MSIKKCIEISLKLYNKELAKLEKQWNLIKKFDNNNKTKEIYEQMESTKKLIKTLEKCRENENQ